jgi:hypothetical protein
VARAVIDHYWQEKPAPWPLTLLADCRRYQTLPRGGGRLDQQPQEMYLLAIAERAVEFANTPAAQWSQRDLAYYDWVNE